MASEALTGHPAVVGADHEAIGRKALALIDKLLAEKPEKVGHDFSEATRCIVAYRDALIARLREGIDEADRQRLMQANTVLSAVLGGHFPLGGMPWKHIDRARNLLARAIGEQKPTRSSSKTRRRLAR